jgi:inner membrane protein
MTGKTHRTLGIASGTLTSLAVSQNIYSPSTFFASLVIAYFGSLLPDIDESASLFWESVPLGRTAGKITDPFLKHRNITHSLLGLLIFNLIFLLFSRLIPDYWHVDKNILFLVFMISYASHLLADMFTEEGIPLFFPLKYRFGIPPKPLEGVRIVTGKWFENLIIYPLINIGLILIIVLYWQKIKILLLK